MDLLLSKDAVAQDPAGLNPSVAIRKHQNFCKRYLQKNTFASSHHADQGLSTGLLTGW
jgi:hypothetical protein